MRLFLEVFHFQETLLGGVSFSRDSSWRYFIFKGLFLEVFHFQGTPPGGVSFSKDSSPRCFI